MKHAIAAVSVLVSACAGAPPQQNDAKPVATVVVPQGQPDDAPVSSAPAAPPPRHDAGDFETCVAELRAASAVAPGSEEHGIYDRALDAEKSGDGSTARKSYFELIERHPQSALIPLAYLAFGEMFRAEAVSDPSKSPLAMQAYREVEKYPPPENIAFAYAALREGDVMRSNDPTAALGSYVRAVDAAAHHPTLPCAEPIAAEARRDIVDTYVTVGAPDKAYAFFKAKNDEATAREMLRDLVRAYRKNGKGAEACVAAKAAPSSADFAAIRDEGCAKR